ncbi:hypothetical protein OGATHE_002075 [Ogataea polymorpha]|uniref:Uncharacterized protein n=1 Tax=Ogataea polymorpha TaxID=460523 RepID=A0A9P8PM78_9ASCO|nr:hypothetical protein OGATHE_002075 [Ogataea polymorpha]
MASLFCNIFDIRSNSPKPKRSTSPDSMCEPLSDLRIASMLSTICSAFSGLIRSQSLLISDRSAPASFSSVSSVNSSSSSISAQFSNCLSKSVTCLETSIFEFPSPISGTLKSVPSSPKSKRLSVSIIGCIACRYDDVDETL